MTAFIGECRNAQHRRIAEGNEQQLDQLNADQKCRKSGARRMALLLLKRGRGSDAACLD